MTRMEQECLNSQEKRVVIHWFMTLFYVLVNSMKSANNHKTLLNFRNIREFAKTEWREFYYNFKAYFDELWMVIEKLDDVTIAKDGCHLNITIRLGYLPTSGAEGEEIIKSNTIYKMEKKLRESQKPNIESRTVPETRNESSRNSETDSELSTTHESSEEPFEFVFDEEETAFEENITRILENMDIKSRRGRNEIDNAKKNIENHMARLEMKTSEETNEDLENKEANDLIDEQLRIRLENQQREQQEEMKQKEEERSQSNKEFQKRMEQVKERNRQKFMAFFNAIRLKERFEEKEREWSDWLESDCKDPIRKLLDCYNNIREELDDKRFLWELEELMEKLKSNYEGLNEMADSNPDAVFIRIIQMNLCDVANKVVNVLNCYESSPANVDDFDQIKSLMSKIKPTDISCTSELRDICKISTLEEFEDLKFPERKVRCYVEIEEICPDIGKSAEHPEIETQKLKTQNGQDIANITVHPEISVGDIEDNKINDEAPKTLSLLNEILEEDKSDRNLFEECASGTHAIEGNINQDEDSEKRASVVSENRYEIGGIEPIVEREESSELEKRQSKHDKEMRRRRSQSSTISRRSTENRQKITM